MKCPVIHEEEPEPSPVRGRLPVNNDRVDFSDYEWMGEELEEFDRKVINVLFFPLSRLCRTHNFLFTTHISCIYL